MDQKELATILLTFVPQVEEPYQAKNRATLEGFRDGGNGLDLAAVGLLLEVWSRYRERMSVEQAGAMSAAVAWFLERPSFSPDLLYRAIRILSNWPMALDWSNSTSKSLALDLITQAAAKLRGRGRQTAGDVLSHLGSASGIPDEIRAACEKTSKEMRRNPSADRDSHAPIRTRVPRQDEPVPTATPQSSLSTICDSLEICLNYLDPAKETDNLERIQRARDQADPSQINLLCLLIFKHLDRQARGDVFIVEKHVDTPKFNAISALARYVDENSFSSGVAIAGVRSAPLFALWFTAMLDLDKKVTNPKEIWERVQARRRDRIFDNEEHAHVGILDFGNRYLARMRSRAGLDAAALADWLEMYQLVAQATPAVGQARRLIATAMELARPFQSDQRVAFLLEAINPKNLKHPWTRPEVFPFLDDSQAEGLESDLRSLRLKSIRDLLTSQTIREKLRNHLLGVLADANYDQFRPPARSVEGFNRNKPPSVEHVRESQRRTKPHETDKRRILREWEAYALTAAADAMEAKEIWERTPVDERTAEETWNLAVVYSRVLRPRKALDVLWDPGLKSCASSYEHVRFAASLALQIDWDRESTAFPQGELFRLIPSPAAQAYAYSINPPTTPEADDAQLNLIKKLANNPIETTLRRYPDTKHADTLRQALGQISNPLVDLSLQSTWRIWLSGFVAKYPRTGVLWETLCDAWSNVDRSRGRLVLENGLKALSWPRFPYEQYGLMAVLRKYVSLLDEVELRAQLERLRRIAEPIQTILLERAEKVHRKLWPDNEPVLTKGSRAPSDPWDQLNLLLRRNADENELRKVAHECIGGILHEHRDIHADLMPWRDALDQLLALKDAARRKQVNNLQLTTLNEWLERNSPKSCTGLLGRIKKLAEWIHGSFGELVVDFSLAPAPTVSHANGDPGIAIDVGEASATVAVHNPAGTHLADVSVVLKGSAQAQPTKDSPHLFPLNSGASITLSVPFVLAPGPAPEKALRLNFGVTYRWGVVSNLKLTVELDFRVFDFRQYLGQQNLTQDYFPKVFEFDTDLRGEALSRLFVGRDADLEFVRRSFCGSGTPPGTPIYFHGIRRVGKTTFLRRISLPDVLPADKYLPLYISLFGLQPHHPLKASCRLIRDRVLKAMVEFPNGSAPPIEGNEDYEVLEAFETFLAWLCGTIAPRTPMILIDEFHNLVSIQAVPLLDLIRQHYQDGDVRFILAGWKDHELLHQDSGRRSQLFYLTQRSISFLAEAEVGELIREQLTSLGIIIPGEVIGYVVDLTAGHPNLVQKLFQLVVEELNAYRRVVVTLSDVERAAAQVVVDRAQFTTSWYNPDIVTKDEELATKEIVGLLPAAHELEGGWVQLDQLSDRTRKEHILPLMEKHVLHYEPERKRLRIKGLLLERFLRSVPEIVHIEQNGRPNVAIFVDYENNEPLFPQDTSPGEIAGVMNAYVGQLGNPTVRVVAANWKQGETRVQNLFSSAGFSVMVPLRTLDRAGTQRVRGGDKDLADTVITRAFYDRMLEEREGTNDKIDIYVVAAGDGRYLEFIKDFVENKGKKCRLLALRGHSYLNDEYLKYERARADVAAMPGRDRNPDFLIDDLGPLMKDVKGSE